MTATDIYLLTVLGTPTTGSGASAKDLHLADRGQRLGRVVSTPA